jgi:rod shape-determining protein MreD
MNGFRLLFAVVLTLLLQAGLVQHLGILGIRPDLMVLLLVLLSLRRGPVTGTIFGFLLGFLQDVLVPQTLGMNTLAKSVVGYGVGRVSQNLVVEGPPLHVLLILAAVLVHDAVFFLCFTGLNLPQFVSIFATLSLPTAIYTALIGVAITAVGALMSGSTWRWIVAEGGGRRG